MQTNKVYESRGQANYSAHKSLSSGFEKYHAEQAEKKALKAKEQAQLSTFVDPDKLEPEQQQIIKDYTAKGNGRRTLAEAYAGLADNGYKRK